MANANLKSGSRAADRTPNHFVDDLNVNNLLMNAPLVRVVRAMAENKEPDGESLHSTLMSLASLQQVLSLAFCAHTPNIGDAPDFLVDTLELMAGISTVCAVAVHGKDGEE